MPTQKVGHSSVPAQLQMHTGRGQPRYAHWGGAFRGLRVTGSSQQERIIHHMVPRFVKQFEGTCLSEERCGRKTIRDWEEQMISKMHVVQNAARMAMADHRAASPRRLPPQRLWRLALAMLARLVRKTTI
jgi:hypothetical protein